MSNWSYTDTDHSHTGIMVCNVCRKAITEGEYRYREKPNSYVNQHRRCSADDPVWAKLDRENHLEENICDECGTLLPAVSVEVLLKYIESRRPERRYDSWTEGFRDGLAAVELWLREQSREASDE